MGSTLALLLAQHDVHCVLLDRRPAATSHPQAHFINMRSMEIFRGLQDGLLDQPLSQTIAAAQPSKIEDWGRFVYCESVTGRDEPLAIVDHFPRHVRESIGHMSPELPVHLASNRLVPMLHQRLMQDPKAREFVDVRFGCGVRRVEECADGAGAHVFLEHADSSHSDVSAGDTLLAAHVVACDGAGSNLRQALGSKMQGDAQLACLANVHFTSPELARAMTHPGMLHFVFSPHGVGVAVWAAELRARTTVSESP